MLAGVQIICFAASYTVAFLLEITRMVFRSGVRGALMLGFAGAGLVAHTTFLYRRATGTPGSPLSSEQDWYLIAAWLLVAVYLYLTWYHSRHSFGLFLLPLVLALIAAGTFLARSEPFAREPASRVWGLIHGTAILLATVAVLMGFAAGVMYLSQDRRLKRKLPPPRGLRLPSLEWLARVNGRALIVAVLMLVVGVASGVVLNALRRTDDLNLLPWYDPVVFATLIMLLWLLSAVVVTARYPLQRQGRKVAYLTLVSFVFLLVALSAMLLFDTAHGGKNQGGGMSNIERPRAECSRCVDPAVSATSLPTPLAGVYTLARRKYHPLFAHTLKRTLQQLPDRLSIFRTCPCRL